MKTELKKIRLIDHEIDSYCPVDLHDFYVAAEALIGVADPDGADIFSFEVSTPGWFARNRMQGPTFARHWMFMDHYDPQELEALVRRIIADAEGDTWDEVANKLARYMFWEFEDYLRIEG
jgi:hypothetical protein